MVLFAHLLIEEDPDHHQTLITCLFHHPGSLHTISLQSIHNFLSSVACRQTNATENITSFAKKVIMSCG